MGTKTGLEAERVIQRPLTVSSAPVDTAATSTRETAPIRIARADQVDGARTPQTPVTGTRVSPLPVPATSVKPAVAPTSERALAAEQTRLEGALRDAASAIENPANQIPELRVGQGLVRVMDERNQRVEGRITSVEGDRIVFEGGVDRKTQTFTRAELTAMLLNRDQRFELRESDTLTAARVPSVAEQRAVEATRDFQALATIRLQRELGPKNFRIFNELALRRSELVGQRETASTELRTWIEERSGWNVVLRHPTAAIANAVSPGSVETTAEAYGEAPQRANIARVTSAIDEIDRAMTSIAAGRGIDFVPQYDGVTYSLQRFSQSNATEPSLHDRLSANLLLLRGAAQDGHVGDGWAAYQSVVQPYLFARSGKDGSFHHTGDNQPSITYAVNQLIANKALGDRRLVTTAGELEALRPQIEREWTAITRTQGTLGSGALYDPNATVAFDGAAFDREVQRLRRVETEARHVELRGLVANAQTEVPRLVSAEPSWVARNGALVGRFLDSPATWATVAVTAATWGTGSLVITGSRTAANGAELIAAARAANLSTRGIASLSRTGTMFAASSAIDGAIVQTSMNAFFGLTGQNNMVDFSPGGYARTMAMMSVSNLANAAHLARSARLSPGLTRQFGEQVRYFGEEVAGLGMLSGVGVALQGGDYASALRELEANAQTMLAMRVAFQARRIVPGSSRATVPDETRTLEANARRLIENRASADEIQAALKPLDAAYRAERNGLLAQNEAKQVVDSPRTEAVPPRTEPLPTARTEVAPRVETPSAVADGPGLDTLLQYQPRLRRLLEGQELTPAHRADLERLARRANFDDLMDDIAFMKLRPDDLANPALAGRRIDFEYPRGAVQELPRGTVKPELVVGDIDALMAARLSPEVANASRVDSANFTARTQRLAQREAELQQRANAGDASAQEILNTLAAARRELATIREDSSSTVNGRYVGGTVERTQARADRARDNVHTVEEMTQAWGNEPMTPQVLRDRLSEINRVATDGTYVPFTQEIGTQGLYRGPGVNPRGGQGWRFPDGEAVPAEVARFSEWFVRAEADVAAGKMTPTELAARSYQNLVSIHPFVDGNGRTSRALMDWVLRRHGLPPSTLIDGEINVANFYAETTARNAYRVSPDRAVADVNGGIERTLRSMEHALYPEGIPALPR